MKYHFFTYMVLFLLVCLPAVKAQVDPDTTERASIDRFSMEAGHLFIRDSENGLPGPNEPIDFDQGEPFMTKGLGPNGELIGYYNFDVQPTEPAPIYALFREGESTPVADQLNIVDDIPGDDDYNDFWRVLKVTVPSNYVANTVTSLDEITMAGYTVDTTDILVNCPIVPEGSTAKYRMGGEGPGLTSGWYRGKVIFYFNFAEKALSVDAQDMVSLSPIYVSFNINPPEGGPPSGFKTEEATGRAHNVVATLPADTGYSPLWRVNVYDNADFDMVHDLASAQSANILAMGVANVNCPIALMYEKIDRFSMDAGNLFVRDSLNGLPGPNEPIDFDQGEPFMTKGLGPGGEFVSYYNFDVQPTEPAPIFVLFREGESTPVEDQHNIVDDIPGDGDYNDFWEVQKVTVPADYVANTVTSYQTIVDSGFVIEETTILVNCPIVPEGSTAELRYNEDEDTGLTTGWYRGKIIYYFNFAEKALSTDAQDMVPLSPIYVTFNINPDQPGGGPPSGFKTEESTGRAHNVVSTLPEDEGYSPLWRVNVYDNANFDNVFDLASAQSANILAMGVANVNCPIVAVQLNPNSAEEVSIDRFSMEAGHLFIRDSENGLPGPNEPIDFDQGEPFMTKGLGPNGELIGYYNFDVQPTEPAPIYVLFREGESMPVEDQLNIVDDIPGDDDYNDFWEVFKVTVPADYVANTVTSLDEITMAGYTMEETEMIVNCPIVPKGSTAKYRMGGEGPGLTRGWYRGKVIYYFNFAEKALSTDAQDMVPLSPIYVAFNINPPEGGPPSGFKTEEATGRAHNVVATLPADEGYSPLWRVNVYDNADFDMVHDLASAQAANILAMGVANVNCPIVLMYEKIDRFSMEAGNLFVRDSSNGLPGPNEPINFDQGEPFMTKGLGPDGEFVSYYNFDVQPTEPAPIFVLFREGESTPVEGQHNIVDDIPGDDDYNDFWEVFKVTVPSNYVANTTTSALQITMEGYPMEETEMIVNCPIVPEGSTAELRYNEDEDAGLTTGWYRGKIIYYFNFAEKALSVDAQDMVPLSPIYVTFNINPDQPGGGPPSGFKTEEGTGRAHNVVSTLPEDEGYSPLWRVNVYDNADFDNVFDLASAQAANILAKGVANVNCPIVLVEPSTSAENTKQGIPDKYSLSQNYPNPFNPSTTIDFALVNNEHVSIKIYNTIGEEVTEVVNETLAAGNYSVNFDASNLSSGVYFYTISTQRFNQTKKMLLLK